MTEITANVSRHGRWWVVEFESPAGARFTQARTLDDVEEMVRDICDMDGVTVSSVRVVPSMPDVVAEYQRLSGELSRVQRDVAAVSRSAVSELREQGVAVRDIAALMGLSPARVSQLARSA